MARKLIDTYPVVKITPTFYGTARPEQARRAASHLEGLIKAHIRPHISDIAAYCKNIEIDVEYVSDHVCEHCRSPWTEAGADYNGGCCGKDEANSPQRLVCLQSLIDEVEAADFYRWDADHGRDRVKVDWPWALACVADEWLKAGRSADSVNQLITLAARVKSSDWCTVWSDPGPSGCSLARLPDRVTQDARPEQLADELLSLLDDMDLLPARQAVA